MMETKVIIAESGGSKTDWVILDGSSVLERFTTCSYHPAQWNGETEEGQRLFWQQRKNLQDYTLYFFGAGCYREEPAKNMKSILGRLGFQLVNVYSDVHAAGFALFGRGRGWGAILGTGSVLFEWENGKVLQIVGGKGAIEGDEGSGFYFGKLLLNSGLLKIKDVQQLNEKLGKDLIMNRQLIAALSMQYGQMKLARIIHEDNIQRFIDRYVVAVNVNCISLVGGYGASIQTQLVEIFIKNHIVIDEIIERPIERLIEQKDLFIE